MARPRIIEMVPIPLPDDELLARIFRVFGDATRLRILELLVERPHIQRELVEEVGLSQGQVSQHLACMTWCGFVAATRTGRIVEYQIADARVIAMVDMARTFLAGSEAEIGSCRVTP